MNSFNFIGGDMRIIYGAKRLGERYDCHTYGLGDRSDIVIEAADFGVLPLPSTSDGITINAPLNNGEPIPLSFIKKAVKPGGVVFAGKSFPLLKEYCKDNGYTLIDYFEREELQVMNAVPTAEGTVEIAIRELPVTINGTSVLITGFGRIATVTARYFRALGAEVYVAARKVSDLAKIRLLGYMPVDIRDENRFSEAVGSVRLIINTVPAAVFDKRCIGFMGKKTVFIELASLMSLEDTEMADKQGVKVIWARSLPGKTAPVTAGFVIADTIANIVMERSVRNE